MKTLAIIDDEQEMKNLYELILEIPIQEGLLNFKFFSDARVFVDWLTNHRPDLVLCDLNMPYLSGIEIGRIIRKSGLQTPLYFISGYEAQDYQDIMKELQVTEFFSKPLDYNEVLNSINSELGL